jgi:hypothetical protein
MAEVLGDGSWTYSNPKLPLTNSVNQIKVEHGPIQPDTETLQDTVSIDLPI